MFHEIKSDEDIRIFHEKTNSLHDGYLIGVQYTNNGISKTPYGGYSIRSEGTKLVVEYLVTSIWDAIVEIVFENLWEWQIQDNLWDITDNSVRFDDLQRIIWSDNLSDDMEELKNGSYAIAKSMKWRFVT